ncbi:hypothetical protein BO85DRAFT_424151 [Aspergillus piperis CBS 112811]|uniref:Ubiquitin-like protease family profile domain-containing protein n=1 Tax=Aspergillus piperis CBS 112811 TaxID=1448313 RepID=A0A8G1VKZ6_9EURO|nr:hypothetical protein BO85DRAFT_424151 [Aspergillus piperis CBS 112811]RAH56210.1 hypothetical protein BO85DRAFT_424151 [Aspergillus piperis CBS 112811]
MAAFSEYFCFDSSFPFAAHGAALVFFFTLLFLLFLFSFFSPITHLPISSERVYNSSDYSNFSYCAIKILQLLSPEELVSTLLVTMSGVFSTLRPDMEDQPMQDETVNAPSAESPLYQLRSVHIPGNPKAVRLNGKHEAKPSFPLRTPLIRPDHRFSPNTRTASILSFDAIQKSRLNAQPTYASVGIGKYTNAGSSRTHWSNNKPLSLPFGPERSSGTNFLLGGKSIGIDKKASHMNSFPTNKSSGFTTPSRKRSMDDGSNEQAQPITSPSAKFRRVRAGSFARSAATDNDATTNENDWYPGSPMDIDTPEHNNEPNMVTALATVEAHLDLPNISPNSRQVDAFAVRPVTALAIPTSPSTPDSRMMPGAWPESVPSQWSTNAATDDVDSPMTSDEVILTNDTDMAEAEEPTVPVIQVAEPQPSSPWYAYWGTWQDYMQTVVSIPVGITQNFSYAARSAANAVGAAKRRVCALWNRRGGRRLPSPPGSPTRLNLRNLSPEQQERMDRDRRIRSGESSPRTDRSFPDFSNVPDFSSNNRTAPTVETSRILQDLVSQEQVPEEQVPEEQVTRTPRGSVSVERRARGSKNMRTRPARESPTRSAHRSARRSAQETTQECLRQQGSPGIRKHRWITRAERAANRERSAPFRALFVGDIAGMKKVMEAQAAHDRQASAAGSRAVEPILMRSNDELDRVQDMNMLANIQSRSATIGIISDDTVKLGATEKILSASTTVAPKTILKVRGTPDSSGNRTRPRRATPRRVRFREPVVAEFIDDTREWGEVEDNLAPHLGDTFDVNEKTALETNVGTKAEQVTEKENVPPAPENEEEDEPVVDPWSQPTFEYPLGRAVSAVSLFYPEPRPIPEGRTESVYANRWRQIQEEERQKELPSRIKPDGPAVRPLSPEWEARIKELQDGRVSGGKTVATTLSGDPLTKRSLATCYTRGEWLNDEIINGYLALIVDYLRRKNHNAGRNDKPRFHAFNSFFFSNLRDKGYDSVARWAKRAKIGGPLLLDVDTVYIPVHNSQHWTLVVVRPGERSIEHFDSLGARSRRHIAVVQTWLRGELGPKYVEEEWRVLPSLSPQQDNGSDCGVFLLTTAKAVAIGLEPLSYGAQDTPLLRRKIVAELMAGGLEGEFDPAQQDHVLL